jgi:N6-L-threonylcarbamoyladenine synthase
VVEVLVHKILRAASRFEVSDLAVAGGVSANSELRRRLQHEAGGKGLKVFIPKIEYCTDNGAMIAMAGYLRALERKFSSLELAATPNLALGEQERTSLK